MYTILTSTLCSSVLRVNNLDIMIASAPRRVHIDIVCIDDINNSRIIEDVHVPFEIISDVDELIKSSTLTLDETHVHEEGIINVQDALVESSTPLHDVRCPLFTPTIEEEIEHKIVATGVDTSESLGCLLLFVRLILVFFLLVIIWSSFMSFFRLPSGLVIYINRGV